MARHNRQALEEMDRRVSLAGAFEYALRETPGWEYRPNARLEVEHRGRLCRVTTNRLGFRGPEVAVPQAERPLPDRVRGGSTTVEGWTDETTYPALLQARLRAALRSDAVEVVNAGISSYSTSSELARLDDFLAMEPDLMLEYGCINDLGGMMGDLLASAPAGKRGLRRSRFLCHVAGRRLVPADAEVERRFLRSTFANLEAMARCCAAAGTRIACASFAAVRPERLTRSEREYVDWTIQIKWNGQGVGLAAYRRWIDLYNHRLREWCERPGHLYLPLAESMPGEMSWFQDLCHMTDAGIARKAEILADGVAPIVVGAGTAAAPRPEEETAAGRRR